MKITITQIVLEFPEPKNPVPAKPEVKPRNDNFLASLFFDLLSEELDIPQKAWEVDPHGTIFKV